MQLLYWLLKSSARTFFCNAERKLERRGPRTTSETLSSMFPTGHRREKTHGNISPVGVTHSLPSQHRPQSWSASNLSSLLAEARPTALTRSTWISFTPSLSKAIRVLSTSLAFSCISMIDTLTGKPSCNAHSMLALVFAKLPLRSVMESWINAALE